MTDTETVIPHGQPCPWCGPHVQVCRTCGWARCPRCGHEWRYTGEKLRSGGCIHCSTCQRSIYLPAL